MSKPNTERALTHRSAQSWKPDPNKRQEVPDGAIPGLYLIVQPSGAKSWALRYRANGRPRKLTLGKFPTLGIAAARTLATAELEKVERGLDPASLNKTAKAEKIASDSLTVASLVDQYMKRHASRNRSAQHIERYFKTELVPVLGSKPAAKVTRADLVDLFDAIVDRGSPVTANRVFANTRALFNWAVGRGAVEQNPLSGMQMPAEEKSRDRVLNSEEIAWLWEATKEIGSPFGPLYRLLLLTGQRLREVAHMSTTEIDGNVWTIPGARAKNGEPHAVPLSPLALETIKDVRMTCDTGIFLFTTNGETPVSGFAKAKSRLDKAMKRLASEKAATPVTIEPFVIHDLRRTVASGMAELGVAPHVCEAVLNHRSGTVSGVARVYNRHDYAVEKRGALEAWANCVAAIIENNSDPDAGRSRASQ